MTFPAPPHGGALLWRQNHVRSHPPPPDDLLDLYARWRDGLLDGEVQANAEELDALVRQPLPDIDCWRRRPDGIASFRGVPVILWVNGETTRIEDAEALIRATPALAGYGVRPDLLGRAPTYPDGRFLLPEGADASVFAEAIAGFVLRLEDLEPPRLV